MPIIHTKKGFLKAAAAGNTELMVEYINALGPGLCQYREDKTGDTALHKAAAGGHTETVAHLLMYDKKLVCPVANYHNQDGETALAKAVIKGHRETFRALLAHKEIQDANGYYPLNLAIQHDRLDFLKDFVATGKAVFEAAFPPSLVCAAIQQKPEALAYLLSVGVDPNLPYMRPESEVFDSRLDWLSTYVESLNPRPVSALYVAVVRDDMACSELLVAAGARPAEAELLLHCAVSQGNLEMAALLLHAGLVDIRDLNTKGRTVLHLAVEKKQPEMVKFLLKNGADPRVADRDGVTAAGLALQYLQVDIIALLETAEPPPPPLAAIQNSPPKAAEDGGDGWALTGERLAHIYDLPGRRLTEVFNFGTKERFVLSENLALKTETIGPHENFEALTEEALSKAAAEYRRLGGALGDDEVFRGKLGKLRAGPG